MGGNAIRAPAATLWRDCHAMLAMTVRRRAQSQYKNKPPRKLFGAEKRQIKICPFFYHPDYTVGQGIAPCREEEPLRRLYCRWGIAPRPKEITLNLLYYIPRYMFCQLFYIKFMSYCFYKWWKHKTPAPQGRGSFAMLCGMCKHYFLSSGVFWAEQCEQAVQCEQPPEQAEQSLHPPLPFILL